MGSQTLELCAWVFVCRHFSKERAFTRFLWGLRQWRAQNPALVGMDFCPVWGASNLSSGVSFTVWLSSHSGVERSPRGGSLLC